MASHTIDREEGPCSLGLLESRKKFTKSISEEETRELASTNANNFAMKKKSIPGDRNSIKNGIGVFERNE